MLVLFIVYVKYILVAVVYFLKLFSFLILGNLHSYDSTCIMMKLYIFLCMCMRLGIILRSSLMQGKYSTTEINPKSKCITFRKAI